MYISRTHPSQAPDHLPRPPHQDKGRHDGLVLARQVQLQQQRAHADEGGDGEDGNGGRRLALDVSRAQARDGAVREVVEEGEGLVLEGLLATQTVCLSVCLSVRRRGCI